MEEKCWMFQNIAMLIRMISWAARAILSLRYRIEVKGLNNLTDDKFISGQGLFILPNHPAQIDPVILFALFYPKFRMRPMVVEYMYRQKFLRPFFKFVDAITVPDFDTGVNDWKTKRANQSLSEISKGLSNGNAFLLYPAGMTKTVGKEVIGGSSGAHTVLQTCPNANILLIRTTGLWGSSFSKAITGKSQSFVEQAFNGVKKVLQNGFFFSPRRSVVIELELNPENFPRTSTRVELNRYLEEWYNRYPLKDGSVSNEEPRVYLSYSFWKQDLPTITYVEQKDVMDEIKDVPADTRKKIYGAIRKILETPDLKIQDNMSLIFDLGMDSLNIAELIIYLTKNFSIGELRPSDLTNVASVLNIATYGNKNADAPRIVSDLSWEVEENRPAPQPPVGRIIPEAFLKAAERLSHFNACADDTIGIVKYKKIRQSALVLSQYFKTIEDTHIAVLMPASVGVYVVILALLLAGKVPVMLNWTLGSRYLDEMMKISGAKKVLSSYRFLDRLSFVQLGSLCDKFILLEDVRENLSLKMKLQGLYLSKLSVSKTLEKLELNKIDENDPCVILFTSGTEAVPKGVPLSHKNILSNQVALLERVQLKPDECGLGILPPFHSFGFSVAGLFPVLSGLKTAFYPDPTDGFGLASAVERWKITLFCAAPSFIKGLFYAAKSHQIKTLRLFVSGAEKAPQELFDRVYGLDHPAVLIEGYGITECGPVLTLNSLEDKKIGVGMPISGVTIRTIHPETLKPLPFGSEGEIVVRGPNIFKGYLSSVREPFIEINQEKWYRTGDLGYFDSDNNLILSGRLKRFTKLGGEMISLLAIEEVLAKSLIEEGLISTDVPSIAVVACEKDAKTHLVLFSIVDIDKEKANHLLHEAGFSNLVKISYVTKIDEIPLLGAGKTNLRALQDLC